MTPQPTPLKKAAIMLASLDEETAAELLGQMDGDQRARVGRAMSQLGEIDPELQRQIVAEFRRGERTLRDPYPSGIELDSGLAEKLARAEGPIAYGPPVAIAEEPPPFRFLHEAEADTLVDYLKHERPQTIAVVVSHLSPSHAAEVVDRLAPTVQAQVLRRLAELDDTDPAILRDVERYLESWLTEQMRSRQRRQAGLHAIGAILSAAGGATRHQLVANLARHDSALAETLGFNSRRPAEAAAVSVSQRESAVPAPVDHARDVSFADLAKLDDQELLALVEAAESEVLVLALAGASAAFVERVIKCMSSRQSRLLRRALKHLGPTRLSDVEEAQQGLADLASNLGLGNSRTGNKRALAAMAT